jgi:rod shape-determining protein MreC
VAVRHRPRSTRLLVVALVSLSLAIITLDYREGAGGPLATLGSSAQEVMAPLQRAVTSVTRPIGNFFTGLANLPTLADENRQLRDQVADYETERFRYDQLEAQLTELQGIVGLRDELDPQGIPAVVIANGASNFDWSITIDRGSEDGIAVQMPVITGTTDAPRVVGKVVSVTPNSANVELLIDPRHSVYAVLGNSGVSGEVSGQGDDDLRMDLIEPGTRVQGNEQVWTQSYRVGGLSSVYPPNLLLGQVSRVTPESNSIQSSVLVRPAVDFSMLEFVLVLTTGAGD